MPICQLKTNFKLDDATKSNFSAAIAEKMSEILEKPLAAVMVMISDEYMYMNNSDDTVVFSEFRYLKNFSNQQEKTEFIKMFSDKMLDLIQDFTNVNPYRIYMQFTEMTIDGAWRYTR